MKKICFITTSRADFGTLDELIKEILSTKLFLVQLIVSGSHNEKIFGNSEKEIFKRKKVSISKVRVFSKNKNSKDVALSFADCSKKFTNTLSKLKPHIFIVFGDRYEMLSATISAYILRIPIAHIAGGEKTSGSIDDGYRHSISKLSNLHFPTTENYKKRLIQLGEDPKTVFNYGSLNVSKIKKNKYLSKSQIEKNLNIKFNKKNLIVTYHPDTVSIQKSLKNLSLLLTSLKRFNDTLIIITSPNADAESILMINFIRKFIKKNKLNNFKFFKSLGSQTYLSLLNFVDGVVGNSSSGISEVPFFGIGTVNIGDRQDGRVMFPSIINSKVSEKDIIYSVKKILKKNFKNMSKNKLKIYGDKNSPRKISRKLTSFNFKKYAKKFFYDYQK